MISKKTNPGSARDGLSGLLLVSLLLTGCAGGSIYAPPGGSEAPPPVSTTTPEASGSGSGESGASATPSSKKESSRPSHRTESEALSPAAASLVRSANQQMANGNTRAAISQLERAQRISPRSGKVYLQLAKAYEADNRPGPAEQFALKGLSLAGSDTNLQRTGWSLLARIRRDVGDTAGAKQAEARAAAL